MEKKKCKVCGRLMYLDKFPTNRGLADGHLSTCYKCWEKLTDPRASRSTTQKRTRVVEVPEEYRKMSECERRYLRRAKINARKKEDYERKKLLKNTK